MRFTQSLEQIHRRVTEYQRSGDVRTILSESALDDATNLIQDMQSATPDRATAEDTARLLAGVNALGWLYYFRYHAVTGDGVGDMSQIISLLVK